jgi:CMP-N-acetylneuraminic acid synthetase
MINPYEFSENVLLAIPARGNSKRLPRKNLIDLAGKPMLAYTIEAALKSGLARSVYVCTEDDEIADVSKCFGACVFHIPKPMAGDEVSSTVPCLALYDKLLFDHAPIDYLFNLQPTSPLRSGNDIRKAFDVFIAAEADFLVSVTPIDPHYFHWGVIKKEKGWTMYFEQKFLKERTMLPRIYRPNGAIKLGKASRVKEIGHFFGHPLAVYEMPEERSIHVASEFDLECAKAMFEKRR